MEELKTKAKALGLWNMFLPRNHFKEGAGFSNLEYGLMAEMLGKSATASEVCLDARQPTPGSNEQNRD
jgi:acyl-CoA dehydrogenase